MPIWLCTVLFVNISLKKCVKLNENHYRRGKNNEESEVQGCEKSEILRGLSLDMGGVLAEGYKTCERGNERSNAADVNS